MDVESCNFHLVATYLPVLFLVVRAAVFTAMHFALTVLPKVCTLPIMICICFIDYSMHRTDRIGKAIGFLLPVAMVLEIQCGDRNFCQSVYVWYWATLIDITWAFTSTLYLAMYACNAHVPHTVACLGLWMTCFLLHTYLSCAQMLHVEVAVRSTLFYVSAMLYLYSKLKSKAHNSTMAPHLLMHIMFVEVYVLLASIVVLILVFIRIYSDNHFLIGKQKTDETILNSATAPNHNHTPNVFFAPPTTSPLNLPQPDDDDLKQLRLAQASSIA